MMIQQSYNNNLIAVIRIISYFKNQGGSFALALLWGKRIRATQTLRQQFVLLLLYSTTNS